MALKQMIVDIGVRAAMRDGVELVGDVYRPAHDGKWPVVLLRCPYDRTDPDMGSMRIVDPAWLCRQGFAVVVQDTRGRGESGGDFDPVYQEVDDGYDTVEWAAAQPWSTGAVGIYGSSYMGITTYQAVASQAPHLRAAVAFIGKTDGLDARVPGGIFEAGFMSWYALASTLMTIARSNADSATKAELEGRIARALADPVGTASTLPLAELDVVSDRKLALFWHDWLREPHQPKPARPRLLADDPTAGDVALLHIGVYRDFIGHSPFELAARLADNQRHRFIAGPWTHRGPYSGYTGARELPGTSSPSGPLGWGPLLAAWFDIHLRGGTGARYPGGMAWLEGDPVRYYVEGENRWATSPRWPPAGTTKEWHLSSHGNARSSRGDGRLLKPGVLPDTTRVDRFTARFDDPFPTCGGALGIPVQGPEGIQDQRAVDHRDDVLVYTSEVLESDVRIAGPQQLTLHFSSSAPDADICVTLVDVEPDGFAYNVCEGFQRTRYRLGNTCDFLEPGKLFEIQVPLHDTAHVFRRGHRIRIMIAGANYPRLSRNLHTTTVPEFGTAAEAVSADHEVHHGPSLRSCLRLNVLGAHLP